MLSHVENINLRKQDRIANGLFLLYTRISPTKQHTKQTRKSGQDEDLLSAMKSLNNQREIKIVPNNTLLKLLL